jgi:hypothetical protein
MNRKLVDIVSLKHNERAKEGSVHFQRAIVRHRRNV